jgi:FG-GAP-like repeat
MAGKDGPIAESFPKSNAMDRRELFKTAGVTAAALAAGTAASPWSATGITLPPYYQPTPSVAVGGEQTFQLITIDPSPNAQGEGDTLEKALIDIMGIGKLDAVLGCDNGIFWYEFPSSGNVNDSWVKHTIDSRGFFYECCIPVDVNNDGIMDLVCSDNDQVVWFLNPRSQGIDPRTTSSWTMHVIRSKGGAHDLHLAHNIMGNNELDIVASSSGTLGSESAIFCQNDTSGQNWTTINFGPAGDGIDLFDIGSGKGAINIVSADGESGSNIVWWENPRETGGNAATGTWIQHIIGPALQAGGCSIAAGVLTQSGRMSVVFAGNEGDITQQGGLQWYEAPADRRNGAWVLHTIDASYQAVHNINVVDINHDGYLDIIVAEQEQAHSLPPILVRLLDLPPILICLLVLIRLLRFNGQRVAVYYNDGNGNFTAQILAMTGSQNQVVGDVLDPGGNKLSIFGANHGHYGAPDPLQLWFNTAD